MTCTSNTAGGSVCHTPCQKEQSSVTRSFGVGAGKKSRIFGRHYAVLFEVWIVSLCLSRLWSPDCEGIVEYNCIARQLLRCQGRLLSVTVERLRSSGEEWAGLRACG